MAVVAGGCGARGGSGLEATPAVGSPTPTLTPLPHGTETYNPGPAGTETWGGATSQGQPFQVVVEDGKVRFFLIGFEGPGCGEWSPMTADFGTPTHAIEAGRLEFTEAGLVSVTVQGSFTSTTVSGEAEIEAPSPCGAHSVTWEAALGGDAPVATPDILIPTMNIDDRLFDLEAGSSGASTIVLGELGDWYMLWSAMECYIAVPKGWSTEETGSETLITFSESGGETPDVLVAIGVGPFAEEGGSSSAFLQDLKGGLGKGQSVVMEKVIDASKAFAVFELSPETGKEYVLAVISEHETSSRLYLFLGYAPVEDWKGYYPIFRAMVSSWVNQEAESFAVPLPEKLP